MSQLIVVRHGQARLFTDDYDRLSDLGIAQARALATAWLDSGVRPDVVWSGSLQRQTGTAEAVATTFAERNVSWPTMRRHDGLNEYPAEEIMQTLGRHLKAEDRNIADLANAYESASVDSDRYRHFHRLLEAVLSHWIAGNYADGVDVTRWSEWSAGVRAAFRDVMADAGSGKTVAVFTSGGVIGVSLQSVLEAPDIKAAELNWRVYNGSVTRYTFSGARVSLDQFNDVEHLPASMRTYR